MLGRYLMVLPVPAYPLDADRFAIEGPFAEHLCMLRDMLGPLAANGFTVASPSFSDAEYQAQKGQLAVLSNSRDGIRFRPVFSASVGRLGYVRELPKILKILAEEVQSADIVHSGGSYLYRPFELLALVMASRSGKTTISVTDIDNRQTPRMKHHVGDWNLREYLWSKAVHSSWNHLQQIYAVKKFSLVLLKGHSLARDYGNGRSNVRFFLDSAFSNEHIIPEARLATKLQALKDPARPLRVVYFGRLVDYKGVDRMIRAVGIARDRGGNVQFSIVGAGPSEPELVRLTEALGLGSTVSFLGTIPFGPELFNLLYDSELLLAAPTREDTPRSALDAAAAGVPVLAFDTLYYQDLKALGAAVVTAPWPDEMQLAIKLLELVQQRSQLLPDLVVRSVQFAKENTQEIWLKRRIDWTRDAAPASVQHA